MRFNFKEINCEEYYPLFFSIVATLIAIKIIPPNFEIPANFDNFIGASITFTSIIIGFLGVSLSVLLSIRETELLQLIFKYKARKQLKRFFQIPIIVGFLNLLTTISLYFYDKYNEIVISQRMNLTLGKGVLVVWLFLSIYFLFSSYRVIDIVIQIIFKDPQATEKRPESKKLDDERVKELKNKYRIKR